MVNSVFYANFASATLIEFARLIFGAVMIVGLSAGSAVVMVDELLIEFASVRNLSKEILEVFVLIISKKCYHYNR